MRMLAATFVLFVIGSTGLTYTNPGPRPNSPFDQYGYIDWEDEKARLDNFAIQLTQEWKGVGAILVFDKPGGCPGEGKARAIRAKRYIVEHRRVPWNRVFWRKEGHHHDRGTTLLIVPEGAYVPYPFYEPVGPQVDGPMTRACKLKLAKIRKSRW